MWYSSAERALLPAENCTPPSGGRSPLFRPGRDVGGQPGWGRFGRGGWRSGERGDEVVSRY
ncbi:MAG TPA: hypothetical protein VFH24_03000, partial [Gemmatimonadales bacterium]|nr:hypothetical protein [Gemmatimonadales bacterium]